MSIGSELRRARDERGLSLRELSECTQIRQPVLRAIETDDFHRLPGGAITRGFLKLYAREVGLDPDEIGRRYAAEFESAEPDRVGDGGAAADRDPADTAAAPVAVSRSSARAGAIAIGAVVVLALIAVGYPALRPTPGPRSDAGDQRTAEVAAPVDAPSASKPGAPQGGTATAPEKAPAAGPAEAPPAANDPSADALRIDLHATGACWVSATADGQQVASRQMAPGERLAIRAKKEAVLRIGFPANLTVSINDQPVRPFERPGTPVTLRITPANYRDLLAP